LISATPDSMITTSKDDLERMSRWTWAHDWRTKIRLSSRSRTRGASQKELNILIREKYEVQP
jgi:hypothetical protein